MTAMAEMLLIELPAALLVQSPNPPHSEGALSGDRRDHRNTSPHGSVNSEVTQAARACHRKIHKLLCFTVGSSRNRTCSRELGDRFLPLNRTVCLLLNNSYSPRQPPIRGSLSEHGHVPLPARCTRSCFPVCFSCVLTFLVSVWAGMSLGL